MGATNKLLHNLSDSQLFVLGSGDTTQTQSLLCSSFFLHVPASQVNTRALALLAVRGSKGVSGILLAREHEDTQTTSLDLKGISGLGGGAAGLDLNNDRRENKSQSLSQSVRLSLPSDPSSSSSTLPSAVWTKHGRNRLEQPNPNRSFLICIFFDADEGR